MTITRRDVKLNKVKKVLVEHFGAPENPFAAVAKRNKIAVVLIITWIF